MRILVTGAAGFVGSVLCPMLLREGHQVTAFDALLYGGQGLLGPFQHENFRFIKGDVRASAEVENAVKEADAVIHLAAIVGFPACRKHPELAKETNVIGTKNVVDSLSSNQLLIYASSGSNYGVVEDCCTEESPLNPVSLYAITKAEGEKLSLSHKNAVALRFATGFGISPRMRFDLLVNDFVRQAIVDKQLIVYERHFRRTFIAVQDMARAIIFALDNAEKMLSQPFNVGHESLNLTKEDIALKIREKVPFFLHFADIGHDEDKRDYEVSYQKIRQVGFETQTTIDKGLNDLIRVMDLFQEAWWPLK